MKKKKIHDSSFALGTNKNFSPEILSTKSLLFLLSRLMYLEPWYHCEIRNPVNLLHFTGVKVLIGALKQRKGATKDVL